MGAFIGFVREGATLYASHVVRDSGGDPSTADGDVAVAIYGPDGVLPVTIAAAEDEDVYGLHHYEVECLGGAGFAAGECYRAVVSARVGAITHLDVDSFCVT